MTIAEALRHQGQAVTVEGVATTKPGLLDSSGERVALQDSTGAVLLRLPASTSVSVGQRVRASGTMGTYYGAPQLSATSLSSLGQGTVSPSSVRSAPIAPALEWRLITIQGTVDDVQKDGDSWRAEIKVGGGSIPVVGIDRSGTASSALVEGRTATVVGIVKRAYPTSTDQRLAIVPRTTTDITLGAAGATLPPPASGNPRPGASISINTFRPAPGGVLSSGSTALPGGGSVQPQLDAQYAVISALGDHVGGAVRVGGRVVSLGSDSFTIEDGTGEAAVRVGGDSAALLAELRPADLVNVTGVVARTAAGGIEVTVADPNHVSRVPAPASLAAATDALVAASQAAGDFSPIDDHGTATPGTPALPMPLLAVALAVALIGAALVAVAVAGPQRRASLVARLTALMQRG
jgi:uncharacterized protein YdeI (BOF family)